MAVGTEFADNLERSRGGDRAALEALFSPWRSLLKLQASQLLGAELAARVDPSDVVQEALGQAFAALAQFRGQTAGEWVNWLRCMVAGQAANAQRRHLAGKRAVGREDPLPPSAPADGGPSPDREAVLREDDARLAEAVAGLPPDMRTVIVRRVFQQEPFEAVARALGRTPGATRVLWTRALRRLRAHLSGDAP
jgi:RNA polymerase sigma-70 factor (ECF subfamily)